MKRDEIVLICLGFTIPVPLYKNLLALTGLPGALSLTGVNMIASSAPGETVQLVRMRQRAPFPRFLRYKETAKETTQHTWHLDGTTSSQTAEAGAPHPTTSAVVPLRLPLLLLPLT